LNNQNRLESQTEPFDPTSLVNRTNLDSQGLQGFVEGKFLHYALVYPNDSEVKRQKVGGQQQVGGGCRGPVTHFSPKSRRNLIKKLMRWADQPGLFQTFTYSDSVIGLRFGGQYPGIEALCDRMRYDLNRWTKRLPSTVPIEFQWRLEIEPRKSGPWAGYMFPHLHLLISLKRPLPVSPQILGTVWNLVACPGDAKHKRVTMHSKSWEWLDSHKKLMCYVSKYCAKTSRPIETFDPETGEVFHARLGRMWGFTRGCVFYAPSVKLLTGEAFEVVKRTAKRHLSAIYRGPKKKKFPRALKAKFRLRQSFSWFIDKTTVERLLFLGIPTSQVQEFAVPSDIPF
jgi:hypothetical protein